jgi:hypothetical protein
MLCLALDRYFKIAPPLDTAAMKLSVRDEAGMQELYSQVKHTVEQVGLHLELVRLKKSTRKIEEIQQVKNNLWIQCRGAAP